MPDYPFKIHERPSKATSGQPDSAHSQITTLKNQRIRRHSNVCRFRPGGCITVLVLLFIRGSDRHFCKNYRDSANLHVTSSQFRIKTQFLFLEYRERKNLSYYLITVQYNAPFQ